jgi:hypothetical protein
VCVSDFDAAFLMRRRIQVCHMRRRIHACICFDAEFLNM